WSPDSKSIAYLQLDTSRELIYPHADLLTVLARQEPQRYPKAGSPNADARLGVVSASGGRTQWMDLGEMRDRLLARVYWYPDSKRLAAFRLNRVQSELHIFSADAATGHARVLIHDKDPYWINLDDDFFFLPKSNRILRGADRDGHRHLLLHDADGKLLTQLTRGDWDVTGVPHVDEAGGRVWIESTQASPIERHIYSVSLQGGEPRRLTRDKGTHTASVSPTGEYWLDSYSALDSPPQVTLRDAAAGAIAVVRSPNRAPLEEFHFQRTELLNFKGSDGTLFYARLIKPVNFDPAKKYPAVVMVYGGPHAQTVRDMYAGINWDQVLANRGFVIWQMDNRGSGGRGHAWESQINRRFGKLELSDQLEGVKHLTSLGFVDPARIGISGWSFGGYMTLMGMLRAPGLFQAGISGAPVTDWRLYDTIYTERYMGLPSENEDGYHDSSPVHFAKELKGHLMLVHNYGDDNVLYQNNLLMQVELQKAGKQFDLLVYPQKAHGVTGALTAHMREAMTNFFERHLMGVN
ncbi:MAG: DPP IV N-terminal domain-containing protein, partial [Bryobacterales bacterium]|nr:DPP IV N-terminal domain-containing protein [Bryobacterales bacterium]